MRETIQLNKVKTWAKNHEANLNGLPFKSLSAAVTLKELESFIVEAKASHPIDFDAVQIYFVRYEVGADHKDERIDKADLNASFSQVSLLFAPAQVIDRKDWRVKVLHDGKKPANVVTLRVCDPGAPIAKDETGMCPPKCPKDSDADND